MRDAMTVLSGRGPQMPAGGRSAHSQSQAVRPRTVDVDGRLLCLVREIGLTLLAVSRLHEARAAVVRLRDRAR